MLLEYKKNQWDNHGSHIVHISESESDWRRLLLMKIDNICLLGIMCEFQHSVKI